MIKLIDILLGKGGSKEVFSTDSDLVLKKFTGDVNKKNLQIEKKLSEKYPNYIAKISDLDFKEGTMSQEKLNVSKFKNQIRLSISDEGQEMFDESGLDDEFEFLVKYPQYNTNKELKTKINKLDTFVQEILIPITGDNIDYPNINNAGYDSNGDIKLLEIFY
jgi:hypothetical protein